MNLFYTPPGEVNPPVLNLKGQEARHAVKVLRIREGSSIHITDGTGNLYYCKVTVIMKDSVTAEIVDSEFEKRREHGLALVLGLIKKRDRLEFAIEKSVELGIDEVTVFRGDHSEKGNVRMDRLTSTSVSAMKQSLRMHLPAVSFEKSLSEALAGIDPSDQIIYGDETLDRVHRHAAAGSPGKTILVVGPEGGFSQNERKLMNDKGGVAYSLGDNRLRTETAAIIMTDRFRNGLQ